MHRLRRHAVILLVAGAAALTPAPVPGGSPAAAARLAPPAGAARVLQAFLDESLPTGGIDRSRSPWQASGRGAASGSDMFPGGIDPRYLRYEIEALYRTGRDSGRPPWLAAADAHVGYLASVVKATHPTWALGNALEAIGLQRLYRGETRYTAKAREIVGWLRQRKVEVHLPDGTTYGHFPCGYGIQDAKDAGWTNDLSMAGAGLVWAYEVTGDDSILADAVSFAEYFVQPWRPNAVGKDGYWECGTWREKEGCWVIGPAHFTGFESTDLYADEASWVFSNLTCADFLTRLERHHPDPRYVDRCARAARWTFLNCQFPDGAVGMCGRDDKWLGFTGAAVSLATMIAPHLQPGSEARAALLRDARRAKAYLDAGLETAEVKTHGVEWVTRQSSTDPLVNVGMIWTYGLLGWLDGQTLNPPPGFTNHGVAARVAQAVWSGGVPAVDGAGRRTILFKLWGQTPPALYVMVDAETGRTTEVDPGFGSTGAYATFLSPDNKFYDTLADRFIEFDVASQKVIPVGTIPPDFAMSMTIGDNGVIYAGMYPNGEVVGFDPKTRVLTNFGPLAKETWPQYPYLAVDDKGWVYAGINFVRGNILALNPKTGEKRQIYPEAKRGFRYGAEIFRGKDGRVYGRLGKEGWYKLYDGAGEAIDGAPPVERAVFTSTVTPPGVWRDGSSFSNLSVPGRRVQVTGVGAARPRPVSFDYHCAGRPIYSMIAGPDKKIYGATGIPLRVFGYDPATGKIENHGLDDYGGHVNQWVRQGQKLYGAVYSGGELLEYDPSRPFEDAPIGQGKNPKLAFKRAEARDHYGRPHAVLAHPDGRHVLVGGNPARGFAGGGLLIYDTQSGQGTILTRDDLVKDQGITAMTALPNGDILVGTTTEAATGGTATAREALVYRLDWKTRKITARWTPVPGLKSIADLIMGPDGLVYGLAAPDHFFVIDPRDGRIVHSEEVTSYGQVTGGMAPRTMALGPDRLIYALFSEAIVRFTPETFSHQEIARPGVPIKAGIVIQDGRLYFSSDTELWSYDLSRAAKR